MVKAVCVFCGSSVGARPSYLAAARRTGELIVERGLTLVYGGGAKVIGIRPALLDHLERPQGGIEIVPTPDLFERKQKMIEMSDAFLILPGGLGTLDEFFEVVTTAQLQVHAKPIMLFNTEGYFAPLLALLRHTNAEGYIYGNIERLFHVVETPEAAFALL